MKSLVPEDEFEVSHLKPLFQSPLSNTRVIDLLSRENMITQGLVVVVEGLMLPLQDIQVLQYVDDQNALCHRVLEFLQHNSDARDDAHLHHS
jgi:hypothetical protein